MHKLDGKRCFLLAASASVIAASIWTASPAKAQQVSTAQEAVADSNDTVLSEIVVTAQKREQSVQKVPIAITAVSGAALKEQGVVRVEQLGSISPGVIVSEFGGAASTTSINIRGVAQLDYADHQESPNALYVDGAYVSFQGATGGSMFDVDHIEVLRGPQGTLFGRNSTGGLIQIFSKKPTSTQEGYAQFQAGSYRKFGGEGAISGPLSDDLTGRLSVQFNRQGAYQPNSYGKGGGQDKTLNARAQLQWKPDSETTDLLQVFGSRSFEVPSGYYVAFASALNPANHNLGQPDSGALFVSSCANLGYTAAAGDTNCFGYKRTTKNPWRLETPFDGHFRRAIIGATNTFTHQLGFATLTSVTNYTHLNKHYGEDDSAAPTPVFGYTSQADAGQFSQELRLNGSTDALEWVAGLYFLNIDGDYAQATAFGDVNNPDLVAGSTYHQNVKSYAAFGQLEYKLTPDVTFILGGRISRDLKSLDLVTTCTDDPTCVFYGYSASGVNIGGNVNNTSWSGRAQLTYQVTSGTMLYAGVNRGTKGALILAPAGVGDGLTFQDLVVRPEALTSYEGGFKSSLLDRRLRVNGTVFYYHYHDYQAYKYQNLQSVIFNAEARDYGAELSVDALLGEGLTATVAGAYLHTKVKGVSLPDGTVTDQEQPFSPKFSLTSSLRKEFETSFGKLFGSASLNYVGSRYFSTVNAPSMKADSYVTGDVSVGWVSSDEKWNATLLVTNVNDKAYEIYKLDLAAFGGYGTRNFAPPRMFTFQLGYNF